MGLIIKKQDLINLIADKAIVNTRLLTDNVNELIVLITQPMKTSVDF